MARMPAGMPGTLTWKAKQVGMNPYFLAISKYGSAGHEGRQARFYMELMMHHRMRAMAKQAAAANQQPPTA